MSNFKDRFYELSYLLERKLKSFDIIDFSILFATLISLGGIISTLKSEFIKKLRPLFAVLSVLGSVYIILKSTRGNTVPYIKNKN